MWRGINKSVIKETHRLILNSNTKPSWLIKEAANLGTGPNPEKVAEILNKAKIDFVIIGAHALGVHTKEPRSTSDVDVVVKDVDGAVKVLKSIKPNTKIQNLGDDIGKRITDRNGKELIDVLYPTGGVRSELFSNRISVSLGGHKASVPSLNAMIALKWVAMFSPTRSNIKQQQDRVDFFQMINNNKKIDIKQIAAIVNKASPLLAQQLIYDYQEYKKTGVIKLYNESFSR